jgi:phosphoglycolate phosphatase
MNVAGVIFDLDGTLVDSIGGITAALNEALALEGASAVTVGKVRSYVGDGPRHLCRRALGEPDPDPARVDRLVARFLTCYAAAPVRDTAPYPGVPELLDAMAPRPLAVCTNKGRRVATLVLAAFAIDRRLRTLIAEDDLPFRKPDPRPLLVAAERLGTAPAVTLVVGDGTQDVLAAHAAGMPCCALLQGYSAPEALLAVRPTLVLERIAMLPGALR